MTLPSYIESIHYYTEGTKIYNCPIFYDFQYYNNQIRPAIIKKLVTSELYKPINFLHHIAYLFPDIPNESNYNKFLKDLLLQIKLKNIDKDFNT